MRSLEIEREAWRDYIGAQAALAEDECAGSVIKPELRAEFCRRYRSLGALFRRRWSDRRHYATPELIRFWDRHPHITFEEWAWNAGFRNKFLREARIRRWG